MYYCKKCHSKHHEYSKIGQKHARYISDQPKTGNKRIVNPIDDAERKRKEFHGSLPDRVFEVEVRSTTIPSKLVVLGVCTKISYVPIGETNKEKAEYVHEFGDWGDEFKENTQPLLCCSPDGRQLYLIGGEYFVGKTDFSDEGWIYG